MSFKKLSQYQWIIFGVVFLIIYIISGTVFDVSKKQISNAKILGQGAVAPIESQLTSESIKPLVSIAAKTKEHPEEEFVDESLFYKHEPEPEKEPVKPPQPKINVKLEIANAVRIDAIMQHGAVVNGQFTKIGQALPLNVRNEDGLPVPVKLVSVGKSHAVFAAAGVTEAVNM
jgi:hypothetical protein